MTRQVFVFTGLVAIGLAVKTEALAQAARAYTKPVDLDQNSTAVVKLQNQYPLKGKAVAGCTPVPCYARRGLIASIIHGLFLIPIGCLQKMSAMLQFPFLKS